MQDDVDDKNYELLKRRSKGFIGKLRVQPIIKRKVVGKRKQRFETVSAIPDLVKSQTIVPSSEANSQMKIIKGKFSEHDLRIRIEKRREEIINSRMFNSTEQLGNFLPARAN